MNFVERYGPWAVIAGASDGVGASLVRDLGARGVNVVLVSIDETGLAAVAASVATDTRTVVGDLSAPDAASTFATATADLDVGLFVYVAGTGLNNACFLDKPVEGWQALLGRNSATA